MVDELLLLSGNDIPFLEAQVVIHPPTLKEIGYITEETFYMGCSFLNFSKDKFLTEKDKVNLGDMSNFDVLMSIIKNATLEIRKSVADAFVVLALIFPEYKVDFDDKGICLIDKEEKKHHLNSDNFEAFKTILVNMCCLNGSGDQSKQEYNPKGERAKMIAEKLKKGRQKAAEVKNESTKINVLSKYVSILSVGQRRDINSYMHYTIYQLFDEFERYMLKADFDSYVRAKLAGAKDIKEVDSWMKDLHPNI